MDINKMIKGIRITAIILVTITVLAFAYGAIENYRFYHRTLTTPITDDDMSVMEWTAEYHNDLALMERSRQDVKDIEARLELLYKEADRVMGE